MRKAVGQQAEEIVDAIIANLEGRKGIGDQWDGIDDEIKAKYRDAWITLARRVIEVSQ